MQVFGAAFAEGGVLLGERAFMVSETLSAEAMHWAPPLLDQETVDISFHERLLVTAALRRCGMGGYCGDAVPTHAIP